MEYNSNQFSIFGSSGFVGSRFCELIGENAYKEKRNALAPHRKKVVYFISTTDNYNVFNDVEIDIRTNLLHLVKVLDGARKNECERFTFISSWFVYGDTKLPAKENYCLNPKGFYSITKAAAENLVESYCKTFNIPYQILRLSNVYGSGDNGVSKKKNALQYLINELRMNNQINLYHNGNFYRDYLHVDDIVEAIRICLYKGADNEVFNIGSGDKILFSDVINLAKEILESSSEIQSIEPPRFHSIIQVKDFYMDVNKVKSLGFEQRVSIEEGILQLCKNTYD